MDKCGRSISDRQASFWILSVILSWAAAWTSRLYPCLVIGSADPLGQIVLGGRSNLQVLAFELFDPVANRHML